ncbi:hypothetical protein D3C78_1034070 [compost metagenome]
MFIRSTELLIPLTLPYLVRDDLIVTTGNNGVIIRKYSNSFKLIVNWHITVHPISKLFVEGVIKFNQVPIPPL